MEEINELEGADSGSDETRRDFLAKAATTAGAMAAVGLVAGMLTPEAESQEPGLTRGRSQPLLLQKSPLQFQALPKGRQFSFASQELTDILLKENLLPAGALAGMQSRMSLSLTYS